MTAVDEDAVDDDADAPVNSNKCAGGNGGGGGGGGGGLRSFTRLI